MSIGEQIKKYRNEIGLSQKELGEKLGVSQAMIAQYENEKRIPKRETLRKIAYALEISDILLLENSDNNFDLSNLDFNDQLSIMLRNIIDNPNAESIIRNIANGEEYLVKAPNDKHLALKKYLLLQFEKLNNTGQDKAIEQVELLTRIPEYQKKDE